MGERIISVTGPDRPGLVDRLSEVIEAHGGNWLESRMANLSGQFAGIVRLSAPDGRLPKLEASLKALAQHGLTVDVHDADTATREARPHKQFRLEIVGVDHPGIVHEVSHYLSRHSISIRDLTSWVESGAMSGQDMFHAEIEADIDESEGMEGMEDALSQIAAKLMVEIQFIDPDGRVVRI